MCTHIYLHFTNERFNLIISMHFCGLSSPQCILHCIHGAVDLPRRLEGRFVGEFLSVEASSRLEDLSVSLVS